MAAASKGRGAPPDARPYPGLRPFEEADARNFFGREIENAAILHLLERQQLVVVHGASGSGKSSVVRAGVIPTFRLDALASDREAKVVIIRPSDAGGPLRSLAAALDAQLPRAAPSWAETLVASPDWRADIGAAVEAAGASLCILIDQFEEIFALQRKGASAEVNRLIEFLISLDEPSAPGTVLGERALSVILTMRSDYLGHCSLWEGLAETVNRAQYLLPKISTVGLLRAIHQPALKYGGAVDEAVADRLLPAMAGEIDGLPVLQHALMRAWHHARPGRNAKRIVKLTDLERIGGAAGALNRHAEEAFGKATKGKADRIEALEWILRALSDIDADRRIIRRSVLLEDLAAQSGADMATVRSIVDTLRSEEFSFVTPFPPEKLTRNSNISVTHEALLRRWNRISSVAFDEENQPTGLVYREFNDGMVWRSISVQAERHATGKGGVLSAAATEALHPWYEEIAKRPGWALRYPVRTLVGLDDSSEDQWQRVAAFMEASEKNLRAEQGELERQRAVNARLRKNRNLILGLSAAVLALVLVVAWIQVSRSRAMREASQETAAWAEAMERLTRDFQSNFEAAPLIATPICRSRTDEEFGVCMNREVGSIYSQIGQMMIEQAQAEHRRRSDCRRRGLRGQTLVACVRGGAEAEAR